MHSSACSRLLKPLQKKRITKMAYHPHSFEYHSTFLLHPLRHPVNSASCEKPLCLSKENVQGEGAIFSSATVSLAGYLLRFLTSILRSRSTARSFASISRPWLLSFLRSFGPSRIRKVSCQNSRIKTTTQRQRGRRRVGGGVREIERVRG